MLRFYLKWYQSSFYFIFEWQCSFTPCFKLSSYFLKTGTAHWSSKFPSLNELSDECKFLTFWKHSVPWRFGGFVLIFSAAAAAKLLQSCPTLCNPRDGSPPGSPVPGILQARTLEWVSFSNAWKWKVKVKSPTRLLRPWDFPILIYIFLNIAIWDLYYCCCFYLDSCVSCIV